MASNSFGKIFKVTTWGESHGDAIGAVIDGCPAGIEIRESDIQYELSKRAPGKSPYTSPRNEPDHVNILSGIFEGKTTGHPISLLISNVDARSVPYEKTKELLKPGHAHFSYLQKYGIFDSRGGGRASARETAARVAAGAFAKKMLEINGIHLFGYVDQIGGIKAKTDLNHLENMQKALAKSSLFCPDPEAESKMLLLLNDCIKEGDSIGGIVALCAFGIPSGLGDPVYDKLEANLAKAMMGIPASKGFEIGSGFASSLMYGSKHNDPFERDENNKTRTKTNHAGGTLGGISTGMPLYFRVAFKPASSIKKQQETIDVNGKKGFFQTPKDARHDPCVAIRAVPVVEAMTALTLADALLKNRCARL